MLAEGTRLQGRYTIREILGQGGMGAVYSAHDASLGDRLVAIKSLHVPLKDPADRARAVDLFRAEARLLAALDHPHIVQIMHCFEEDGKHYLVMVYVDGTTMERLIETSHPLPMPQILGWADQLADALEYLHGLKPPIIFRDLKPGNVMIDHRGHVRLIDFGIARLFTPTTQTNTLI
ncbi:MAG TPA: serine/threonine-protein kinase, partial [Candidatus Xenobia bacterium]